MKRALAQHGRIALWLAWAVPFGIYAWCAYRTVGYWDIGEMDTVPWILGIAHPTGFPAFVILGWFFTHLVPIGSIAYRVGLMCALAMSLAAWLVARIVSEEHDAPWIGMTCAWLFAFGDVAWTRGTRAEVHALAALAIAATLYLALRWYRTGSPRAFVAGGATWAVGLATHPVALLIAPGLLILLFARIKTLRFKTLATAVGLCIAIVAGFYAYLPLRSAYVTAHHLDPTRAIGLPIGGDFWDYGHPATWKNFRTEVTGSDFDVNDGVSSIVSSDTYLVAMPRYAATFAKEFGQIQHVFWAFEFTLPIGAILVLFGIYAAFVRSPVRAAALLAATFISVTFALGFTEEGDPNRYFLTSYLVGAVFAGDAAMWLVGKDRSYRWAAVLGIALLAGWLVYVDRATLGQRNDHSASAMVDRVLQLTPPDAILFSSWSSATPFAYAAYVEHRIDDRILVVDWVDGHQDEIRKWLKTRPVYLVGPMFGEVHGYHFDVISIHPELFRLVANPPFVSKKVSQ